MRLNILPCTGCKLHKGRGMHVPVVYHVNMHRARYGVISKGFHMSPTRSSCYPVLGLV